MSPPKGAANQFSDHIAGVDKKLKWHLWPLVVTVAVWVVVAHGKVSYAFDKGRVPAAALGFMKSEHIAGNMFNSDEFGDYMIYSLWPEYRVFIDGRNDMYGAEIVRDYRKVATLQPGWQGVFKKYNIYWVFCNANSALSLFLTVQGDWKLIYADNIANIFVKDIPSYQYLINKYARKF